LTSGTPSHPDRRHRFLAKASRGYVVRHGHMGINCDLMGRRVELMNDRVVGWIFVAIQIAFLAALVLLPSADHWPTPSWLRTAGLVLTAFGWILVVLAALGLGRSLTPSPVPVKSGQLRTTGLYRYARHPIYTGVLAIVLGLVIASGNVVTATTGIATFVFFNAKASWEEQRLRARYPDYEEYAAGTARFFPHPR